MTKTFKFHNAEMSIEAVSSGAYVLKGMNTNIFTNDSTIYDYCDDDEHPLKCKEAKRTAYKLLKNNIY